MEEIHIRLKSELTEKGYTKPVMATRAAGLDSSQGLRDVLAGRKRLSAELLALLAQKCGVDADYVTTGIRRGEENSTPAAQLLRMKVLASLLADELDQRKASLPEVSFHELLDALWPEWAAASSPDTKALRQRIGKALDRKAK